MRLIIASIPRAGSTYLLRSILNLGEGTNTPPGIFMRSKPFHYPVVKTHSKAQDVLHNGYKAIFLYRSPEECIISTRLNRWDKNHFLNCGVDISPSENQDIYSKDILDYEGIFDSWMQNNGYPVMAIRYDTMNKHFDEINTFIGKKIDFLPWKEPQSNKNKISKEDYIKVYTSYRHFRDKMNEYEEIEYYE
jgi:hypothetical protein